ncbi:hypothetical protein H7S55_05400 [Priestia aryabhattai]|uniref:hypothetical protein n=1 Tax=Priestia aryabhattai TaxID=412384 RepID=UPI001C8E0E1F|nr:hypothetical protein [Priestia aryabhattai]MBX9999591.1 hypothetical protein [Priestia aryabhattai]
MEKDQLLIDLKELGSSFHVYKAMINDSAEQKTIQSARQLEQDGIINLDICEISLIEERPMVEIKGFFI